ncbi:MAG: hypothetical protein ACX932_03930 [Gammaproteobacteria bacterium]
MNERGIILISVLALLLTISLLWTSLAVRLHQMTTITATIIDKNHTQIYIKNIEPFIRQALNNNIYPPSHLIIPIDNPFSLTIQLIDAQSKPNINHYIDEEQKKILLHAMAVCGINEKKQDLAFSISQYIEQLKLYQTSSINKVFKKQLISPQKTTCFINKFYALPEDTTININTATKDTLLLLAPHTNSSLIDSFIHQRQENFFTTREMINNNYYLGDVLKKYDNLSLVSDYFYSIITFKKLKKSIRYETLWYREFDPQHSYVQKLWTIEI